MAKEIGNPLEPVTARGFHYRLALPKYHRRSRTDKRTRCPSYDCRYYSAAHQSRLSRLRILLQYRDEKSTGETLDRRSLCHSNYSTPYRLDAGPLWRSTGFAQQHASSEPVAQS